jgi:hypothetical protein
MCLLYAAQHEVLLHEIPYRLAIVRISLLRSSIFFVLCQPKRVKSKSYIYLIIVLTEIWPDIEN